MDPWHEFSLVYPRFDQSTFSGRLRHFLTIIDPRTLFATHRQQQEALSLLDKYKNHTLPEGVTVEELWDARKIRDSTFHPDTGEKIPMPFRMAGFVPFGTVTVVGMLLRSTATSVPLMMFWQWLNQTHNACVNYYNRNASSDMDNGTLAKAYIGATSVAMGFSVGVQHALKRASFLSASSRALALRFIPIPSVSAAGACNSYLMRRSELDTGIEVLSVDDTVSYGLSQEAARRAVMDTALTRGFMPIPVILVPLCLMQGFERALPFIKARPPVHLFFNVVSCLIGFWIGLPVSISMFPQRSVVAVEELEEKFHHLKSSDGSRVTHVAYNKGL